VQEVVGNVIVVESVPAKVRVLEQVNVLPLAIVKVQEVAGAVRATLLIEVAVATPKTGVTNLGDVSKTNLPVPVAPVRVTPSMVACPETVGVVKVGVANVGDVSKTNLPVPVAPVRVTPSMVACPETVGVVKVGVAIVGDVSKTNLPVPVAPVGVTPSIVQWPEITGVTKVGEVAPTIAPEPVFVPVNPCTAVVAVSWVL
jgi:hypothetical protein